MTDTPRTIAEFNRITSQLDGAEDNLAYALSQMSGLACTLERELVAAQAENERLQNLLYEMLGELTALRAEKQMRDQIAALRREDV